MPERGTSGFHRPGRHCLHQVRSPVRCSASRIKGELHPTKNRLLGGLAYGRHLRRVDTFFGCGHLQRRQWGYYMGGGSGVLWWYMASSGEVDWLSFYLRRPVRKTLIYGVDGGGHEFESRFESCFVNKKLARACLKDSLSLTPWPVIKYHARTTARRSVKQCAPKILPPGGESVIILPCSCISISSVGNSCTGGTK